MKTRTKRRNLWERSMMMMLSLLLVLSSFTTLVLPKEVQADGEEEGDVTTFYVSSDGGDANDGTEGSPFATIGKAFNSVTDEGTIILLSDITLGAKLSLSSSGKTVTIQSEDENDKKSIIRDENYTSGLISVGGGGSVTFRDLIIDGNNVNFTGNDSNRGAVYAGASTTTFINVEITNHQVVHNGGTAVLMAYNNGGEVIIQDNTKIHGNTVTGVNSGNPPSVLGAGSTGKLIIEGGLITDNTVTASSNGVIVGIGSSNGPSFTMTGGKITENHLNGTEFVGDNTETVGNVAVNMRGTAAQAAFNFSGTAFVYDNLNSNGEQRNVFLKNTKAMGDAYLSLIGAMQEGAKVGVFAKTMPTSGAPIVDVAIGKGDYTPVKADAGYFYSDKATSAVVKFDEGGNKVILAPVPPTLDHVWFDQSTVDGKEITLVFNDEIAVTDLTGFEIKVGENVVDITEFSIDPDDPRKLILTLENEPDDNISLIYTKETGNLKGKNGMPVDGFDFNYPISFASELTITAPTGDSAQVTVPKPEVEGKVTAGSTVEIIIKDKDDNIVPNAGGPATVTNDDWTFTPSIDLPNGNYTFEVTATSNDGKTSVTKTKEIAVSVPQWVDYEAEETVSYIDPESVDYDEATGKFIVPADIEEFTFTDGDTEMTATKGEDGEWIFVETIKVPYVSTGVTEISPESVDYDEATGEFIVPDDVTEFTFTDDGTEMTATKGEDGEWTFVETVKVDKSKLQTKTDEVATLTSSPYTPATWGPFEAARTVADNILKDPDATQEEVDDALATLNSAHNGLQYLPTVDKSLLRALVNSIQGLTESDYTPESWEDLEPELTNANNVLNNSTATQQDINAAREALKLKHDALVLADPDMEVDKAALQTKVTNINAENLNEEDFTPTSWKIFKDWLLEAEDVLADPDATQSEVNEALTQLDVARKALTSASVVDKTALQAKVTEISGENLNEADFTSSSWQAFQNAFSHAETILNDANATQEEVDAALASLTSARNGLIRVNQSNGQLISLVPLFGSLSPSFSSEQYHYLLSVSYGVSQLPLSVVASDPFATIEMSVNDQSVMDGNLPLVVGTNTAVITVTDVNGHKKTYMLIVTRDGASGGGGTSESSTPTPSESQPTKETIVVDLEVDGNQPLEKTSVTIERTTETNGRVNDYVALTPNQAQEAVDKAKQIGNDIARIVIPDAKDEVDEVRVELSKRSLQTLRDNSLSLEISTDNVHIAIPVRSMDDIDDDVYFRLVPIREENERNEIEERARVEQVVRDVMNSDDIEIVARPMTIETNLSSHPVTLTLPLKGVTLPTNQVEKENYLQRLAIFIEHTDGEKVVVFPEVVELNGGNYGLRFSVSKFSTFTIIDVGEDERNLGKHIPYIKGFTDGTFRAEEAVTRAQVAAMLARNLGYTGKEQTSIAPFSDVASSHYASGLIRFVKENGLMIGDLDGKFRPNAPITRGEMAKVVANYLELEMKVAALTFTDTNEHWASLEIEAIRNVNIIDGYTDGTFKPRNNLNRAEAVKMINRMFERGPLYGDITLPFKDVRASHWAFNEIAEAAIEHTYITSADGKEMLVN